MATSLDFARELIASDQALGQGESPVERDKMVTLAGEVRDWANKQALGAGKLP